MKKYKLAEALELAAKHGFTYESLQWGAKEENRVVHMIQDWTPKGAEIIRLKLALGKYRGNDIGRVYRDEPDWRK